MVVCLALVDASKLIPKSGSDSLSEIDFVIVLLFLLAAVGFSFAAGDGDERVALRLLDDDVSSLLYISIGLYIAEWITDWLNILVVIRFFLDVWFLIGLGLG